MAGLLQFSLEFLYLSVKPLNVLLLIVLVFCKHVLHVFVSLLNILKFKIKLFAFLLQEHHLTLFNLLI